MARRERVVAISRVNRRASRRRLHRLVRWLVWPHLGYYRREGGHSNILPSRNRRYAQKSSAQIKKYAAACFHRPNHRYAAARNGRPAMLSTRSNQSTATGSINGMSRIERHVSDQIAFPSESFSRAILAFTRSPSNEIEVSCRHRERAVLEVKRFYSSENVNARRVAVSSTDWLGHHRRLKVIGTLASESSVGYGYEWCSRIFAITGSVSGLKRHFLRAAMAAESSNAEPVLC
jgi:hypothetical protein